MAVNTSLSSEPNSQEKVGFAGCARYRASRLIDLMRLYSVRMQRTRGGTAISVALCPFGQGALIFD